MNNKKLITLGLVAAITLTAAIMQIKFANKKTAAPTQISYLVQGLDTDSIGSISVTDMKGSVTLNRAGNIFVVLESDNHPAQSDKINDLLTKCLDLKPAELTTDDPANHIDLGVTEETATYTVKFFDKESNLITGIIMSEVTPQKGGSYIRLISSNSVYLALDAPWLNAAPIDYIDSELLPLSREKIESVTVKLPSETYTLNKKDGSVTLAEMPEGRKLKPASELNNVFNALAGMTFTDVKRESTVESVLDFDKTFTCRLSDSTVYTFELAAMNENIFAKCKAEFTDETEVTKDRGVESEEQLKKKEAILVGRNNAKKFTRKTAGWVYKLANSKSKYLTQTIEDLTENIKPETPEETTE
jgi:hypothetical protein